VWFRPLETLFSSSIYEKSAYSQGQTPRVLQKFEDLCIEWKATYSQSKHIKQAKLKKEKKRKNV